MKKIFKLSRSLARALLAIIALQTPGSILAIEQKLTPQKQNLVRRLVADYKETRELYRKRKTGKASLEEIKRLEEHMRKIKKAAIKAGVIATFITALFVGKQEYEKYRKAPRVKPQEAPEYKQLKTFGTRTLSNLVSEAYTLLLLPDFVRQEIQYLRKKGTITEKEAKTKGFHSPINQKTLLQKKFETFIETKNNSQLRRMFIDFLYNIDTTPQIKEAIRNLMPPRQMPHG